VDEGTVYFSKVRFLLDNFSVNKTDHSFSTVTLTNGTNAPYHGWGWSHDCRRCPSFKSFKVNLQGTPLFIINASSSISGVDTCLTDWYSIENSQVVYSAGGGACGDVSLSTGTGNENLIPLSINASLPNSCVSPSIEVISGSITHEEYINDMDTGSCGIISPALAISNNKLCLLLGSIVMRIDMAGVSAGHVIISLMYSGTSCQTEHIALWATDDTSLDCSHDAGCTNGPDLGRTCEVTVGTSTVNGSNIINMCNFLCQTKAYIHIGIQSESDIFLCDIHHYTYD
jgi:hypothetical protein